MNFYVPIGFCISVSLGISFGIPFFNVNNGIFSGRGCGNGSSSNSKGTMLYKSRVNSIRVGINRVSYNPSGLGTRYQSASLIMAGVGHGYMDNWGCSINYRG